MKTITLKEVLQDLPPGMYRNVKDVLTKDYKGWSDEAITVLQKPELQLFCDSEQCKGIRLFEYNEFPFHYNLVEIEDANTSFEHCYIEYLCQNCKENLKAFSLIIFRGEDNDVDADVVKFGEFPFYGPNIPSKLISLIGPDRELFLKGCRSESLNLGIAAFSYYRRVIENQKDRIIEQVINVFKRLEVDESKINLLVKAKKDNQFSNAIDEIKEYLPKQLYINNQNPFKLLHKALSVGIHNLSDDECLEFASSIRTILTEFSDRLASVLKDQNELEKAIKTINTVK